MTRIFAAAGLLLACLLPAAHALRMSGPWTALAWLVPLACLAVVRRPFVRLVASAALALGALNLAHAGAALAGARLAMGLPVARLAAIMALAVCVTLAAALALGRTWPVSGPDSGRTGFCASALVFGVLALFLVKGPAGLVAADRFAAGAGWLEAAALALYAGFVAEGLADPVRSPRVRRAVWTAFSLAFFAQLGLGLAGFDRFLLTGALHLPVPALILAGPIYRGEGFFMPALFVVSALLVGPAWCSHLCYVGAWDSAAAGSGKPEPAPAWLGRVRA